MQIYVIKSEVSSTPLAEVRTDGRKCEFLVDNTKGKLPRAAGTSFDRLKQIVDSSSHMSMEEAKNSTVGLLRYIMTNGDIVEMTTDGKTALLNDELLSEEEKNALFQAISTGELTVAHRADPSKPIPVMPSPGNGGRPVQVEPSEDTKLDIDKINDLKDYEERQRKDRERSNKYFDETIEKSAQEYKPSERGLFKHLFAALKYDRRGD